MKKTIEKWYKKLEFPKEFDVEFYGALKDFTEEQIDCETYDLECKDGKKNLLSYLYFCEKAYNDYINAGIDSEIAIATLKDIVIWCENWTKVYNTLCLYELAWLKHHLKMEIFRIGRLQYTMNSALIDLPKYDVKKGDNVIGLHIPRGEKLSIRDCLNSMEMAKKFFDKHYPEFKYKAFTCNSWMLDDNLKEYLPNTSNILAFRNLFDCYSKLQVNRLLKFIFTVDTNDNNIKEKQPTSSFAKNIKDAVLMGKEFYEVYGVIKAE